MRFTTYINNPRAIEWGLSLNEAYLFSWLYELPSWAESIITDNEVYYFASRLKVIEELPLLTKKPDTVYRWFKDLEEKGLVRFIKMGKKDYVSITKKGKKWNYNGDKENEKLGRPSEQSDSSPSKLGQPSEKTSDSSPTYNSTIRDNKTIIKEGKIDLPFSSESFAAKWEEWLAYRREKKLHPYKPTGLKNTFKHLQNISQKNEVTAIKILEQSMSNGWQGLFELKGSARGQMVVKKGSGLTYEQQLEQQRQAYTPITE